MVQTVYTYFGVFRDADGLTVNAEIDVPTAGGHLFRLRYIDFIFRFWGNAAAALVAEAAAVRYTVFAAFLAAYKNLLCIMRPCVLHFIQAHFNLC